MQDKVLEFIQRRFKIDCKWTDGNCYYFAVILKDRFPEGKIFYDVIWGHFIFEYLGRFYDWTGIKDYDGHLESLIEWDNFNKYDSLQRQRIVQDCLF